MKPTARAVRHLALVLPLALIAISPGMAREANVPAAATAASALPPLPPQNDPWLYRGSDVPHDKDWAFGILPNGLRWAVRSNQVPPGQVSIRIRIDAGAMYEHPGEEGFAHLIEHLVFRQSRYLGEAQAIPTWQRLGATF
ncbi:MAG TPA: insulinase family protein, partial [Novosphingobium sp.]|nr:insulinase family protein [Novosphingobium sp.]